MARIVSPEYPAHDQELVRRLTGELGFVVDVTPARTREYVVGPFTEFIDSLGPDELAHWRVTNEGYYKPDKLKPVTQIAAINEQRTVQDFHHSRVRLHPNLVDLGPLSGVHVSEVSLRLQSSLIEADLARIFHDQWLGMHPELAWLYKCRLTEEIARRNLLAPTTDQLAAHAVLSQEALPTITRHGTAGLDTTIETAFGLLAVTAVVPADLSHISVDKIIEVRRRFGDQFDRWREYVDRLGASFAAQLRHIESPDILVTYLNDAVHQYSTVPIEELRRGLASVGLDMMDQTMNSKFELPAGLAAVGLATQPHLAAATGIAAGAIAIRRSAHRAARAAQVTPVAYLLSVRETLTPESWMSRVIHAIRRVAGLRE